MKNETTAAALVLLLVRGRLYKMLGTTTYGELMEQVINLDVMLGEIERAESQCQSEKT